MTTTDDDNRKPAAAAAAAAATVATLTTAAELVAAGQQQHAAAFSGGTYFAIRKCDALQSPAIFTNWKDCAFYIDQNDSNDDVEYEEFENGLQAISYIVSTLIEKHNEKKKSKPSKKKAAAAAAVASKDKGSVGDDDGNLVESPPAAAAAQQPTPAVKRGPGRPRKKRPADDGSNTTTTAASSNPTKKQKGNKSKRDIEWDSKYQKLIEYKTKNGGSLRGCTRTAGGLAHFIEKELQRMKKVQEQLEANDPTNLASKYDQERVRLMKEIGIDPVLHTKSNDAWESKFYMLKEYKDQHGTCVMTKTPDGCSEKNLYAWVRNQRQQMNLYENPPPDDSTVALNNNNEADNNNAQQQQEKLMLTEERYNRLKELGLPPLLTKAHTQPRTDKIAWDGMFDELKKFKEENGHVRVPTRPQTLLVNWIIQQRAQYDRMKAGQKSTMTNERLAKLLELGLAMQTNKRLSFEERAAEWLEYKTKHGKEPSADRNNSLGVWARSQRQKYAKKMNGEETTLTDEQIATLDAFGFKWSTGYKRTTNITPPKSWDERFEELVEYKRKHGNVNVPQNTPVLGSWVHRQRREFSFLKRGLPSPLTPDKIERLRSIGFVFRTRKSRVDAEKKKRNIELGLTVPGEDEELYDDDDSVDVGPVLGNNNNHHHPDHPHHHHNPAAAMAARGGGGGVPMNNNNVNVAGTNPHNMAMGAAAPPPPPPQRYNRASYYW